MGELIILGAGASIEAGIPDSLKLLEFLKAAVKDPDGRDLVEATLTKQREIGDISPEKFLSLIGSIWSHGKSGKIDFPPVVERTYFSLLNSFQNAVTVRSPGSVDYLIPLVKYVASKEKLENRTIISLNFDNAIETACESAKLWCKSMPGYGDAGLWYAPKAGD